MISMYDNPNYIRGCVQAGALGYVLKEMAGYELVPAIRECLNQGVSLQEGV